MSIQKYLAILFLLLTFAANSQTPKTPKVDTVDIIFKDTVGNLVFDSIFHDLGMIEPLNCKLVKHFKYIGTKPMVITRTWTQDPHFICDHPDLLLPNKIYSLTICFYHKSKQGKLNKVMGFYISDGNEKTKVILKFKGQYLPIEKTQNE